MPFDHETVVGFAKSFGLIYLIVLSVVALAYTYWPTNKKRFEEAALLPLDDKEDKPWR
jgi:cytochrome c oxidase cbb3-type subunit 4